MKKIISFIFAILILTVFHSTYIGHGKFVIYSNAPQAKKISFVYNENKDSIIAKADKYGIYTIYVRSHKINGFKILKPEKLKISKIEYFGLNNEIIYPNKRSVYKNHILKTKPDIFNFLVIGFLSYFVCLEFLTFLFSKRKPSKKLYNNRQQQIEFLRIIFTIVIVYFHLMQCINIRCAGGLAVEFFFILSDKKLSQRNCKFNYRGYYFYIIYRFSIQQFQCKRTNKSFC